jgi:hypothetical protein
MKRIIVAALAALTLVAVAAPAQAQATPYLSAGEAARVVGAAVHREYDNIQVGSLNAHCPATRNRSFRRCVYTYYDHAGQCWTGAAGVRELWNRYVYRFLYDARC